MKKRRLILIALTSLLFGGGSCTFNKLSKPTNNNVFIRNNVKNASYVYTYYFPTNWFATLLEKNYISVLRSINISFYDSKPTTSPFNSSNVYTTTFYTDSSNASNKIMVAAYPGNKYWSGGNIREPTHISFYSYGYTKIVPEDEDYFSGYTGATFTFNNFYFKDREQYEKVMGSAASAATISGTSIPTSLTSISQWKSIVNELKVKYTSVTDIKFSSNSSDISDYTDTGYTIGTTKIYRKGTSIVFYDTNKIKAPSDVSSLFSDCTSLKTLDLSNLDMSSTTTYTDFLTNCSALTSIVAPSSIAGSFTLPSTFYDKTTKGDTTTISSSNALHTLSIHKSHTLTHHAAKAATCSEAGNDEYYVCDICGAYFSDSSASNQLSSIPYIQKLDHLLSTEIVLSEDKKKATIKLTCTRDNASLGTVESTSVSVSKKVDPTCEVDGSIEYDITYSFEGKEYQTTYTEKPDKLGHKYVYVVNLSDDKTTATIDVYCQNEGDEIVKTITDTKVTADIKKATHYEDGLATYTITYSHNGEEKSETIKEELPQLTDELTYECILDENDSTKGQIKITNEKGEVEYVDATVTSEIIDSTCHSKGSTIYSFKATHEGCEIIKTLQVVIDEKAHDYEYDVTINNESKATVKKNCKNEDNKTIETVSLDILTKEGTSGTIYYINVDEKEIDITSKVESYLNGIQEKKDNLEKAKDILDGLDTSSVKSSDADKLTQAKEYLEKIKDYDATSYETYIAKYNELKAKIESITDSISKVNSIIDNDLNGVTIDNVTSNNETKITEAKELITGLLSNSDNLTNDEKAKLNEQKEYIDSLNSKLSNDEKIEEINSKFIRDDKSVITLENVKVEDKSTLSSIINDCDDLLTAEEANLTTSQKETITEYKDKAYDLLAKLSYSEITSFFDGLTTSNVTSDDESKLDGYKSLIESITSEDGANKIYTEYLTADQINTLNGYITGENSAYSKLKNEINNIKETISSFESEVTGYENSATTTSLATIKSLLSDITDFKDGDAYKDRLTEDEKATLTSLITRCETLILNIEKAQSSYDSIIETVTYSPSTVTSDDKEDIEGLISQIDSLMGNDYLSADEKNNLITSKSKLNTCLDTLSSVDSKIKQVSSLTSGITKDNASSSNKKALNDAKSLIDELLASNNLTEEERASLTNKKNEIENILASIEKTSDKVSNIGSSISDVNVDNVNSSNKDKIQEVIDEIDELLASNNLTEEERDSLTKKKEEATSLLNKIEEVQTKIKSINNKIDSLNETTVTSNDKESIEETISETDTLLSSGNLTEEEISSLMNRRKEANRCLDTINEVGEKYDLVKEKLTELSDSDDVDKDALSSAIKEAEELQKSSNLTEDEKSTLTSLLTKAKSVMNKNTDETKSLIPVIIVLSVVAALELAAIILKKRKDKKKITQAYSFALLPTLLLVSYPTSQIVTCVILSLVVVALAVYLVILFVQKPKKTEDDDLIDRLDK